MTILDDDALRHISSGYHIPPRPAALAEIQQRSHTGDLPGMAEVISQDVELSGLMLKTINSPLFGLGRQVTNVKQACVALGFQNVVNIITACLLRRAFSAPSCLSLERFWDEALEKASLCRNLCQQYCPTLSSDDAFVLGLFHDCGIAALSIHHRDTYLAVLTSANQLTTVSLEQVEHAKLGITHTEIGYAIAKSWYLPEHIAEIIARHHQLNDLASLTDDGKALFSLLTIALNISEYKRNGHNLSNWVTLKGAVLAAIAMSEQDYLQYLANDIQLKLSR